MSKDRLEAYIRRHAASQQEFAAAVGISSPHLSHLLSGKRRLTWDVAKKISAVTKIPMSRLMEMRDAHENDGFLT